MKFINSLFCCGNLLFDISFRMLWGHIRTTDSISPPTYFLLMECVDCVSPSLSKLLLFRWFLPVIFDITAFVFHDIVVSLIPSVRFGASFCRNLGDGRRIIPKCIICVSTAGELFCRRVWFLHPVVLVFEVVHTLITLCPLRGRTKTIKWPFFSSHWWLYLTFSL